MLAPTEQATLAGGSGERAGAMRRRLALAVLLVVLGTTTALPSLASPLMTFDDGCVALNNCSGRGLCRDGAAIAKPSDLPGSAVNYGMAVCLCESHWRGDDCSVRTCVNDCSGRGVCTSPGHCECNALPMDKERLVALTAAISLDARGTTLLMSSITARITSSAPVRWMQPYRP